MLVALPALTFLLIFLHCLSRRDADADVRSALLTAAVVWGVALTGITEVLSLRHALTREAVAWSWAAVALGSAGLILFASGAAAPRWTMDRPGRGPLAMALVIGLIVLGTGLSAAAGWPNQWDSMVYHLSRVDHWTLNRTVDFYPTHIVRQLFNPPWAEYAIFHFRVLGGDDRWSNAPQWLAMAGSVIGVSAIARRLGAAPRGQFFAALVAATIPMGILQASGTQNDYVVALWLVCLTEAALSAPSRSRRLRIGAALGLALLAKGTALLFAAPLLLITPAVRSIPWTRHLAQVGGALLIALALNAPHWARNIDAFGWPLGPRNSGSADGVRDKLTNDGVSSAILVSNVVRNLTLHVGTTSRGANLALEGAVERVHGWLGVSVDDPRSTRLYSDRRFAVVGDPVNPDRTGNPLHLLLVVSAAVAIAGSRRLWRSPGLARYGVLLAVAFLFFCLVLKWQPWHSRLQLPLFVLASPMVAVAWEGSRGLMAVAAVLASLLAARPLLWNRLAPLAGKHTVFNTPRDHQYFQAFSREPSSRQRGYLAATDLLRGQGCADLGILLSWDDWEHPLWVLLAGMPDRPVRIEHVAVTNDSARLPYPRSRSAPCALLVGSIPVEDSIPLDGRSYARAWAGDGLSVFLTDGPRAP